jgi:chromosome segregation ATPase
VEIERRLKQAEANADAMEAGAKRAGLELWKQADQILVQTSRVNQKDAELVSLQAKFDELLLSRTKDARALDQAQSALQIAKADADERCQRAREQIEQYEKELSDVRTELEVKKSELEAVRLRVGDSDAVNCWTKSKAGAHTPTTKNSDNMEEEDQFTRRLMERIQAMEAEIASLRWGDSEKGFEMMECSNEG